jgi:selenocysteine-specific elongation factor
VDTALLPVRTGLSLATVQALLSDPQVAVVIGTHAFHPAVVAAARESLEACVQEGLRVNPLGDGTPMAGLPSMLPFAVGLVEQAVADLVAAGRIERRGAHLTTPGWQPVINDRDAAFRDAILAALRSADAEPPDVDDLAQEHKRDPVPILRLLEREGLVVAVEPARFYATEAVDRLVTRLRGGMTEGKEYSPSELRDVLGLSRKYLIPFLEYCDRKRITERRATGRVRLSTMA